MPTTQTNRPPPPRRVLKNADGFRAVDIWLSTLTYNSFNGIDPFGFNETDDVRKLPVDIDSKSQAWILLSLEDPPGDHLRRGHQLHPDVLR